MTKSDQESDRPGDATWRVIEPFWQAVSIYDGALTFLRGFEQLPQPVGHLFAVWWCNSEVCNGGFHQFFSNSTGVLAPEAAEGFQAIGLHECSKLVELAISKFGEPYPRDRAARNAELRTLERPGEKRGEWDPFCELDESYFAAKKRLRFFEMADEFANQNAH